VVLCRIGKLIYLPLNLITSPGASRPRSRSSTTLSREFVKYSANHKYPSDNLIWYMDRMLKQLRNKLVREAACL
jgi:hypothetical protein